MLTTKQIVDLIKKGPGTPGFSGRVEALKRFGLSGTNPHSSSGTESERRLLTELQDMATEIGTVEREKYMHPQDDPRAHQLALMDSQKGGERHEFTPTDLAWLNRLPTDPAAVSYDDAVHLAALAKVSHSFSDRSGARLVNSIWLPIKEQHDARAAAVELRNANAKPVPVPRSALGALADAIANETDLDPDEAHTRASKIISEFVAERDEAQATSADAAREAIARAEQATKDRTAVTKPRSGAAA